MKTEKVNIFIDETSHLEYDNHYSMCVGYIQVKVKDYQQIKADIKKIQYQYKSPFELKWSKFSKSRLPYYKALVDYFYKSDLSFRCVVVKPKSLLNHRQYNQGKHDNFYYKMIYFLILSSVEKYNCSVFLDIKDTRGKEKLNKIEEVFENKFKIKKPFNSIQHLRSEDNIFIQLADFFIGTVNYKCRAKNENLETNQAKQEFIMYLEKKIGFSLDNTTPPWEEKFNIFNFQPQNRK